jgi:CRISPR/Cas system-associated protein Csm6
VPRHYIEISLPTKPLKNVDTTIAVWSDDEKLGEMRISRGSLDWRSARKKTAKSISWERLAELLDSE